MKQRNPMVLVPLFAAAAAAVYLALVQPCAERLRRERKTLVGLREEVSKRKAGMQNKSAVEDRMRRVEAEIGAFDACQLEPLLESYAMRAKSIVGEMAMAAGLSDAEFSDRPARALPVLPGKSVPAALHERRPVLISCYGDYAAIVSFILRVERDLPHVALGGLKIVSDGSSIDVQRAEIVLEWPAKGAAKK